MRQRKAGSRAPTHVRRGRLNRRWLALSGSLLLSCSVRQGLAEDYFDPAALEVGAGQQKSTDLSYFSRQGGQQPGTYRASIYLDGQKVDTRDVEFISVDHHLEPVLTVTYLNSIGVNTGAFSTFSALHEGDSFTCLGKYIPDAFSKYDFSLQRLDISIPQAALSRQSRGYVPPEQWDEGIPAAFVDYTFTGSSTHTSSGSYQSNFLNLRNGTNLGAWRLRNYSSYQYDTKGRWRSRSTWLQRDIIPLKSQLRLGDTYTSGDMFDSVQFRGINLTSDDNMLPDSQRGFAPTIRGVAHSNARVSIRQHGYVIYETYVAPGAFVINDLFPTAQSGDLEVTVRESDGSERKFTQPYSAVPFMQREGRFKYSVSAGRYKSSGGDSYEPKFVEGTFFYGMPWHLTLYGGTQLADNYSAASLGLGRDFGDFGALGVDTTRAKTDLGDKGNFTGQSMRAQYQKDFDTTDTAVSLASYRYSTRNFYQFSEANEYRYQDMQTNSRRSRSEATVSQDFGRFGNLSLSAYRQDYWNSSNRDRTLHLGYYNSYRGITWGLGYYFTRARDEGNKEQSVTLNISIPLSKWLPGGSVNYSMNNDTRGHATQQASLYGSALEHNNLYYSLQHGYDNRNNASNSSANLTWRTGYGELTGGYSHDENSNRVNYGMAGGAVATGYGVTFSQTLGDSIGLVRAPGAADVNVEGMANVHTNGSGYAVMPTLSAYRKNTLSLGTETLGDDVDLEQNSQMVLPTSGAVVLANYKTHLGARVLITLTRSGMALPFGAQVQVTGHGGDENRSNTGIVGDGGVAYLSGVPEQGTVRASWQENGVNYQCSAPVQLPPKGEGESAVRTVAAECR